MNYKSIDINQRIPLDTLHIALETYLNDTYSEDYIMEQLRLEFKGENRLKKSLRIISKTTKRSPLDPFLVQNKDEIALALKIKADRNLILISLFNSVFSFSYDTLRIFGKYFAVQKIINTATILKSLSSKYGGNRATENGMYSVIPMFVEAGIISRSKTGIYEKNGKFNPLSDISKRIFIESFKINNTIEQMEEYHKGDPYFEFIKEYFSHG